jgi:hypothetical protein
MINVAIAATINSFLDPRNDPEPVYSRGSPSGVLLLCDFLKGFFNEYFSLPSMYESDIYYVLQLQQ